MLKSPLSRMGGGLAVTGLGIIEFQLLETSVSLPSGRVCDRTICEVNMWAGCFWSPFCIPITKLNLEVDHTFCALTFLCIKFTM